MTDEEIETGTVSFIVTDVQEHPLRNVHVTLADNTMKTDSSGEVTFEHIIYGSYNVNFDKAGYEPVQYALTVDNETVEEEITLTHLPLDPNSIEVDLDEIFTFNLSERTCPDYTMSTAISEWLKSNLESLTDDNDNTIFSKVNNGFNENTLKTFGKQPTCDVYIDSIEYDPTFDYTTPKSVKSIIIFYMKGANNNAYMQCCALHDYLMQEFIENDSFRRLDNVVKDTFIINSELMTQPINKKWGVMGAFELSHKLY